MSSYLINTRQKAEQAIRQRNGGARSNSENELHPAVIVVANGDGWNVATIDAQGNTGRVYERIFAHPIATDFEPNDEVWLWLPGDGETPIILAAGGGGGGCAVLIDALGVHFG